MSAYVSSLKLLEGSQLNLVRAVSVERRKAICVLLPDIAINL